jgi:hypothetical protein
MFARRESSRGRAALAIALVLTTGIAAGLLYVLLRGNPIAERGGDTTTVPRDGAVAQGPNTAAKRADALAGETSGAAQDTAGAASLAEHAPHVRVFGVVTDKNGAPLGGMCVRLIAAPKHELEKWRHDGAVLGVKSDPARVGDTHLRETLAQSLAVTTGENGAFELKAPERAEPGSVVVAGAGYETQLRDVGAQAPVPEAAQPVEDGAAAAESVAASSEKTAPTCEFELNFTLQDACSIAGTVFDRETRAPAAGVLVAAGLVDNENPAIFDFVKTDSIGAGVGADGSYVLQGVPLGEYRVLPRAGESDYAPMGSKEAQRVVLQKGVDVTGIDFLVSRGGVIRGIVRDAEAKPLAEARVRLMPANLMSASVEGDMESLMAAERESRMTSGDGAYEFRGCALDKEYRIGVSRKDFASAASAAVKLTAERPVAEADITLTAGWTISGRVVYRDGAAAAKTEVMIVPDIGNAEGSFVDQRQVSADENGAFAFEHLAAGTVKLHAGPISAQMIFGGEGVTKVLLDGTTDVTDVTITIDRQASAALAGIVSDTWGAPLAGAQVAATCTDGLGGAMQVATSTTVTTGADGKFAFADLKGGKFKLRASKQGYSPARAAEIASGMQDVELRLAKHGRVNGVVVTAAGAPPGPGGKVLARPIVAETLTESIQRLQETAMGGTQDTSVAVRDDGSFGIDAPAGKIEIRATVPGFAPGRSEPLEIVAGQEYSGVKVLVTAGAIVRGKVTLGDGRPVAGAVVRVDSKEPDEAAGMLKKLMPQFFGTGAPTSPSAADGVFSIEHLANGEYVVSATHDKYAPSAPVTVALGQDQVCDTVTLVLLRGGSIAGKVLEQDKPKGGMMIQIMGGAVPMKQVMTDATGEFFFNNLGAGDYVLNIMDLAGMQQGKMSVKTRVVSVENERTSEVTIAIGAGRKVFGKVKGYPAAPMRVLTLRKPGGPNPEDVKQVDIKASLEGAKYQVGVAIVAQDDTYEIVDIEPGAYILEAPRMPADPTDLESYAKMEDRTPYYRKELTVKDEDLEHDIEIK